MKAKLYHNHTRIDVNGTGRGTQRIEENYGNEREQENARGIGGIPVHESIGRGGGDD